MLQRTVTHCCCETSECQFEASFLHEGPKNQQPSVAEVVGTGPGAKAEAVSEDSRGLLSTSSFKHSYLSS